MRMQKDVQLHVLPVVRYYQLATSGLAGSGCLSSYLEVGQASQQVNGTQGCCCGWILQAA